MPETATSRMCLACDQDLPFDRFAPQRRGKYGLKSRCQECLKAENRARYEADKGHNHELTRAWVAANRERRRATVNAINARHRLRAIEIHGGECVQCGATEPLFFDHVEGGGSAHRKREGSHAYIRRISHAGVPDPMFQLLCEECHAVKTSRECSEAARRYRASVRA